MRVHCEHEAHGIPLEGEDFLYKDKIVNQRTFITSCIIDFFKTAEFTNCPRCGGLIPELFFILDGKQYRFCCYKIEQNGTVLKETDYNKLGKWCKRRTNLSQ